MSKAEATPAKSITIALPDYVILRGAEQYLHRFLLDRPVFRGDTVHVRLLGQPFVFLVARTSPAEAVVITEDTDVTIRDTPITEEDLRGERSSSPRSRTRISAG